MVPAPKSVCFRNDWIPSVWSSDRISSASTGLTASVSRTKPTGPSLVAPVDQDRPPPDAHRPEHAVWRPWIALQPCTDRVLGRRRDDVQHFAIALQWAAEDHETLCHEVLHET